MKEHILYLILIIMLSPPHAGAVEDPWSRLQQQHGRRDSRLALPGPSDEQKDPWAVLRSVYLPFSTDDEFHALNDPGRRRSFTQRFNKRLKPFDLHIQKACKIFNIPKPILKSLIMAESGGNPLARAGSTSAKGLTQTIDATFRESRKGLARIGIDIINSPFDPEASIMAGAWYLNQMVDRCIRDGKSTVFDRNDIAFWRYPLEYYYAGPGNGIKTANKIYVFSNGERRIIDKRAYSRKIQAWAQILTT